MPRRGTTTQQGYGSPHQQLRAAWAPHVATGTVTCPRCLEPIASTEPWDLGHNEDRTSYTGPEHQGCNRAAGARKANRARANPRSRDW